MNNAQPDVPDMSGGLERTLRPKIRNPGRDPEVCVSFTVRKLFLVTWPTF